MIVAGSSQLKRESGVPVNFTLEHLEMIFSLAYGLAGSTPDDEAGRWTEIGMIAKEALGRG